MKKIVIVIVFVMALGLTAIIVPIALRYDSVQYEKNMLAHIMSSDEDDVVAEYNGQKTLVVGRNINRVASTLSPSTRKRLFRKPDFDPGQAVVITFPDGARFTVSPAGNSGDTAYIVYEHRNQTRYFSITGLKTFEWITRAVSPEGVYNENEVVGSAD
ncbi:MAG: hypothetical protein GX112_14635 [Clostridiaceae bacterium]|nr:hypothetical protein [Clostridiaceae bacterium]